MGKNFLLTLLLSLVLVCTSCSHQKTQQKDIVITMKAAPRSLDPREARLLSDITLIKHLYEGLVEENANGDIELALAQSYTVSEDGKTYTFKLKPSYWSNGEVLKAQDFVRSWNEVVLQKIISVYGFAFDHIQNIHGVRRGSLSVDEIGFSALDDFTLEIKLQTPISHFLKLLALPVFYPIHQAQPVENFGMITNGAFYVDSISDEVGMHLQKNPFYYKQALVKTPGIQIHFVQDPNTASLFFNQKMIHWQGPPWGTAIPQEKLTHLKLTDELHTANIAGTSWLLFNAQATPFQNHKLRKALSLAIDKELLSSSPFFNNALPAYHLLPALLHDYPQVTHLSKQERQNQAKQLFKEALLELNLSAKDLEQHPILFSNSSQTNAFLAHLIREQWADILGFTPSIIGKEFALLQSELTNNHFSLAIGGWVADFSDPMTFLSILSSQSALSTYTLENPKFSQLIHNIQVETETEKRLELISEASLYLEQLYVVEPLYHEVFLFASSKSLTNFHLSSTGIADLRFAQTLY